MNVRRPGFQLLSLLPSDLREENSPTFGDTPCLLPDQIRIYLNVYLPLFALSLLAVFVSNVVGARRAFHSKTSSNLGAGLSFREDIEETHQDETNIHSNYKTVPHIFPPSQLLPGGYQNNLTSRSLQPTGWFVLQGSRRKRETDDGSMYAWIEPLCDAMCSCSYRSPRFRRRTVLTTALLDARDIAVFPLACFVLITWWAVTR